jgi:hypothetical protein
MVQALVSAAPPGVTQRMIQLIQGSEQENLHRRFLLTGVGCRASQQAKHFSQRVPPL